MCHISCCLPYATSCSNVTVTHALRRWTTHCFLRTLLQSDDRAIKEEGLDALSDEELRQACRARGMRTPYGEQADDFMRRQLQEWLDLSLNRCVHDLAMLFEVAACSFKWFFGP